MTLMTAFVKSRPLFQTWTSPTFQLMPRLRLQPSPSSLKESMSFLLMKPILTLKVTGMLLKLIKKNPLRTFPVSLKGIRLWKRRMKRPLPFSSSFFFFTCKLLTFDHLRGLLFTIFIYPSLMFVHSYAAFCFQFLKHVSVRPFKELFIQELNIPVQFGISKWYHGIDPSIFGLLSRNIDSTLLAHSQVQDIIVI